MIKVEIKDKEYEFPESWDDITMKDYCNAFYKLAKTDDSMDEITKTTTTLRNEAIIISRLLGEKDDFVLSLPLPIFAMLKDKVKFIYDIGGFLEKNIFYLNIDGKKYWIPSPEEMSLRQYIDSDIIMRDDENKQQFIELLACLLIPTDKEEYDGNYEALVPKIERMKAADGLPFVYTFFKKKIVSKKVLKDFSRIGEVADLQLQNIQGS